jgi:hypothetical protein
MHRPAFAFAETVSTPVDFEHHSLNIAAFGDAVPMPAMSARDPILIRQMFANANRDRFLTGVEVGESRNLARLNLDM